MDHLPELGTSIAEVAPPTFKLYAPLLIANGDSIRSTKHKTFQYGPHERQALDVYYPTTSSTRSPSTAAHEKKSETPILIFLHGGGLVRGAKTLVEPPGYAQGLAHANIGHFFADQTGYVTVVPDYRLMQHGARFPSGGEDVALVVEWVSANLASNTGGGRGKATPLFIMGNSAGGIHLCTYLFAPQFAASRRRILVEGGGSDNNDGGSGLVLKGAILLSVPFHFRAALASRSEVLRGYFGDRIEEDSPLGLLKTARQKIDGGETGDTDSLDLLVLNGTLDPENEILEPKRAFLDEWERSASPEARKAVTVEMMQGQNHISPPLTLGTGIDKEEAWGHQVARWIEGLR